MSRNIWARASPCLSFPCKIPANWLGRLLSDGDLSPGGSPAPPGPRRGLFGKEAEERFGLCKDLRTLPSPFEPAFSGKLSGMTITRGAGPPRRVYMPWSRWLPASSCNIVGTALPAVLVALRQLTQDGGKHPVGSLQRDERLREIGLGWSPVCPSCPQGTPASCDGSDISSVPFRTVMQHPPRVHLPPARHRRPKFLSWPVNQGTSA